MSVRYVSINIVACLKEMLQLALLAVYLYSHRACNIYKPDQTRFSFMAQLALNTVVDLQLAMVTASTGSTVLQVYIKSPCVKALPS